MQEVWTLQLVNLYDHSIINIMSVNEEPFSYHSNTINGVIHASILCVTLKQIFSAEFLSSILLLNVMQLFAVWCGMRFRLYQSFILVGFLTCLRYHATVWVKWKRDGSTTVIYLFDLEAILMSWRDQINFCYAPRVFGAESILFLTSGFDELTMVTCSSLPGKQRTSAVD